MPTIHLGYSTHSEWLAAVNKAEPVNALSIIESSAISRAGVSVNKQVIVLSQAQGNVIHYLRLFTDSYQSINGFSAAMDPKKHEARAESAWHIIQAWLGEQGLTFRRSIIAFPKGLRLLDGSADGLMEYHKELDAWLWADRIDPVLLEPYQPAGMPAVAQAA